MPRKKVSHKSYWSPRVRAMYTERAPCLWIAVQIRFRNWCRIWMVIHWIVSRYREERSFAISEVSHKLWVTTVWPERSLTDPSDDSNPIQLFPNRFFSRPLQGGFLLKKLSSGYLKGLHVNRTLSNIRLLTQLIRRISEDCRNCNYSVIRKVLHTAY